MPKAQRPKRQQKKSSVQQNKTSRSKSEKQTPSNQLKIESPQSARDKLSKIWLREGALNQLERKDAQFITGLFEAFLPSTGLDTTTTAATEDTEDSGAYSSNFQQTLINGGIYYCGYRYPDGRAPPKPNNWDEIKQRLMQPVPSLSPSAFSDEKFEEFVQADEEADNEEAVRDSVITKLLDNIGSPHVPEKNFRFANLDPLNGIDRNTLEKAQPDFYYGAEGLFLNHVIRDKFSPIINPSMTSSVPILPNLFIEAKGPRGQFRGVKLQACYDGAIGTRAMHCLQSFAERTPVYDNKAYTISATYYDGQLKMYSHYTAQANGLGTRPEYYMHQLISFAMTGTKESYLQGLAALQNAADWAREMRETVIHDANEMGLRMAFEGRC